MKEFDYVTHKNGDRVRIEWYWDDVEDQESEEYPIQKGWIRGYAEDGSVWTSWIQFADHEDWWEHLDEEDFEMLEPPGSVKELTIVDYWKRDHPDYWLISGLRPNMKKRIKDVSRKINPKQYFNEKLGRVGIDIENGSWNKKRNSTWEDPYKLMVKNTYKIPLDIVEDNLNEYTEFIRVKENGEWIIRATEYGLVRWLMGLSDYGFFINDRNSLKGYVGKWILPGSRDALPLVDTKVK
tara:strand:- start:8591 stop:9304 length:714 start_codon:yes stop_codon:yes gene_type:complete